ncbi:MAG: hypothetical protein AAGI15_11285 [Pseudomonadota bacterium]
MNAKRWVKLGHTLGAIGLTGALIAHLILLSVAPPPEELAAYHAIRVAIDAIARWLLLPSLTLVLTSGLAALAAHAPFREQRWVWAKVLLGLSMFEGTLVSVQGPAQYGAELTGKAMAGELSMAEMLPLLPDESDVLWVVLTLAFTNIVLAIWRPRMRFRKVQAETLSSPQS